MTATPHTALPAAHPLDGVELEHDGADPWGEDSGGHRTATRAAAGPELGLFSIGLGLCQMFAPRAVARAIGLEDDGSQRSTMRAFGFREYATGVGLLNRQRPTAFAWGRVARRRHGSGGPGPSTSPPDGTTQSRRGGGRRGAGRHRARHPGRQGAEPARSSARRTPRGRATGHPRQEGHHRQRVAPEEAYRLWRNFENLPRFMAHLESVGCWTSAGRTGRPRPRSARPSSGTRRSPTTSRTS